MADFITKLIIKVILAFILFFSVGTVIFSAAPMTDFLLSLIVSHLLLDKLEFGSKKKST